MKLIFLGFLTCFFIYKDRLNFKVQTIVFDITYSYHLPHRLIYIGITLICIATLENNNVIQLAPHPSLRQLIRIMRLIRS